MSSNQKVLIIQEGDSKPSYRVQTTDQDVHNKLYESNHFKLVGWGVNVLMWIHKAEFESIQVAHKTFELYFGDKFEIIPFSRQS
jgi:hypothetical protein